MLARPTALLLACSLVACGAPRVAQERSVESLEAEWVGALEALEELSPVGGRQTVEYGMSVFVSTWENLLALRLRNYELAQGEGQGVLAHWPFLGSLDRPQELTPEFQEYLDRLEALAEQGLPDRGDRTEEEHLTVILEHVDQLKRLLQDSPPGPPTQDIRIQAPDAVSPQLTIAAREGDADRLRAVIRDESAAGGASVQAARLERARREDRLQLAGLRLDQALSKAGPVTEADLKEARVRVVELLGTEFADQEQLRTALVEAAAEQALNVEMQRLLRVLIRETQALRAEVRAALAQQPETIPLPGVTVEGKRASGFPILRRSLLAAGSGDGPTPAQRLELAKEDWERNSEAALTWLKELRVVRSEIDFPDPHHARGARRVDELSSLIEAMREQAAELEAEQAGVEALRERLAAVRRAERAHRSVLLRLASAAPVSR